MYFFSAGNDGSSKGASNLASVSYLLSDAQYQSGTHKKMTAGKYVYKHKRKPNYPGKISLHLRYAWMFVALHLTMSGVSQNVTALVHRMSGYQSPAVCNYPRSDSFK